MVILVMLVISVPFSRVGETAMYIRVRLRLPQSYLLLFSLYNQQRSTSIQRSYHTNNKISLITSNQHAVHQACPFRLCSIRSSHPQ